LAEENKDEVPDTVDELLGKHIKRRKRGFPTREEREAWRQQQKDRDIERLAKARSESNIEALHIELPKKDVELLRSWISKTGEFESVDDFIRRIIRDELDNLPWDDLEQA